MENERSLMISSVCARTEDLTVWRMTRYYEISYAMTDFQQVQATCSFTTPGFKFHVELEEVADISGIPACEKSSNSLATGEPMATRRRSKNNRELKIAVNLGYYVN